MAESWGKENCGWLWLEQVLCKHKLSRGQGHPEQQNPLGRVTGSWFPGQSFGQTSPAAFPCSQISPDWPSLQNAPLHQGPSPSCSLAVSLRAGRGPWGGSNHTMCPEQKWPKAELVLQ